MKQLRLAVLAVALLLLSAFLVISCTSAPPATSTTEVKPTAPATAASAASATPVAKASAATEATKPAAAATPASAAPTTAAAVTPAAVPPVAVLEIVPVPGNKNYPQAIKGTLAGATPVAIYMGTTGLDNVSIGVPVFLQGSAQDSKAPAKTFKWTLTAPSASKAKLVETEKAETSFIPDVVGVYKVDLAVTNAGGTSKSASTQIHAGTYVGVEKGKCASCHSEKVTEWSKTGHSVIFSRELNGGADPATSHYAERCIVCHTTGYYQNVKDGGFADVQSQTGWKFPELTAIQTGKGQWEAVPAALKVMGNIQCESCHGPASEHVAGKMQMPSSLDEGVCNTCHNGGGNHVKGEMLKNAKHADATSQAWTYPVGPDRQDCVRCHSGKGFITFLENPTEKATWDNGMQTVTCAVCHDPHSDENTFQLRLTGKPVEVKGVTKDFGLSTVCVECHNARTEAQDAVKASFPHYSSAAEMMAGIGGVDYGQQLPNSVHGQIVGAQPIKDPADKEGKAMLFGGNAPGACVACHMWPTPADAKDPNQYKVGAHSFNMVNEESKAEYTAACQSCHAGIKDFDLAAKADYDGNGKTESAQAEIAGLLTTLQKAIGDSGVKVVQGHPYFDRTDVSKANDKQKNAIYNYLFVRGLEGSDGKAAAIHNFKRSAALLQASYKDLTGKDVPNATLVK